MRSNPTQIHIILCYAPVLCQCSCSGDCLPLTAVVAAIPLEDACQLTLDTGLCIRLALVCTCWYGLIGEGPRLGEVTGHHTAEAPSQCLRTHPTRQGGLWAGQRSAPSSMWHALTMPRESKPQRAMHRCSHRQTCERSDMQFLSQPHTVLQEGLVHAGRVGETSCSVALYMIRPSKPWATAAPPLHNNMYASAAECIACIHCV